MKIIVPIKKLEYIDKFIECGADEFYGGVLDSEWESRYGQMMEYNRRGNYGKRANVESESQFYQMVEHCAKREHPFFLTLNALKITDEQREIIGRLLDRFKNAGGQGVIISDISLINDIKERNLKPVISSCAEVVNHHHAEFLKKIGCKKIIFPRDITLQEIRAITEKVPDMEYEMFFMNSGCRFTDGNCLGIHGTPVKALCEYCDGQTSIFARRDNHAIDEEEQEMLLANKKDFADLWKNTCAICNLYDVKDYVQSLKIVERVASEERILKQIILAKENVEAAKRAKSRREYLEILKRPGEKEAFCKDYMNCYYRTDMVRMEEKQSELEEKYQQFLNRFETEGLKEKTEYVGMNVSVKNGRPKIDYKIYYNTKASLDEHHPVVDALHERGMLRAVTRIHDTVNGKCERFDLGLAKRTPENMTYFLKCMADNSKVMRENLEEIQLLNQMKISEKPEDAQAALYFFGFLEKEGKIDAVKTHFLTRFCRDVDQVDTKDRYEDEYYLNFLQETKIAIFQELVPVVRCVNDTCKGHLWMVGVDYFEKAPSKYKIYIKKRGLEIYAALREAIAQSAIPEKALLIEELEALECWQAGHEELVMDGVAVSLDANGQWSLNFYNFWR